MPTVFLNRGISATPQPYAPPPPPPPPPTSNLLTYLQGLKSSSNPYILSGQHSDYFSFFNGTGAWNPFSSGSTAATAVMQGSSATYKPAMLGVAFTGPFNGGGAGTTQATASGAFSQYNAVNIANAWLALNPNGIIHGSCWMGNPVTLTTATGDGANGDPGAGNPWPDVLNSGTTINTNYNTALAAIAAQLNSINGTIILRPFVEANLSGTNWYSVGSNGVVTGANQQALWSYTRSKILAGITNPNTTILWNWNINVGTGDYITGYVASQTDIVSFDCYDDNPGTVATGDALYTDLVSTGKPIIMSELGNGSFTTPDTTSYDTIIANLATNCPACVGAMIFCQGWSQGLANTAAQITSFYTDAKIIRQSQLPIGI